jgi:hypothetical protein
MMQRQPGNAPVTKQPDLQARYLVSMLDVLTDELKARAADNTTVAMCRSARAQAQRLVDALSSDRAEAKQTGVVLPFRKRG